MKLNKIVLAMVASTIALSANAGVTVSPLLLGYHYTPNATDDKQREILTTGKLLNAETAATSVNGTGSTSNPAQTRDPLNGGIAKREGLYTGAAIGIELTPATQFQVEYGVSNTSANASDYSFDLKTSNRFEAEQQTISGNFLVGLDQFTGYNADSKFKPYALVGAGQSKLKVENKETYVANASNGAGVVAGETVVAGTTVNSTKDTIGNVGLGARYLVNDALALRGEARAVHNFDNNWWEGLALAGLEVTLGGRLAPAVPVPPTPEPEPEVVVQPQPEPQPVITPEVIAEPEPVVVDSDMDGVPDHLDACPGTARNLRVDARGCPIAVPVQEDLRMELRVFFDNNKSAVKPQFKEEIAKVAEKMREFPNATAAIEGHASKVGAKKYNQRLSEARANAVKSVLSNEFGIAPNRLSTVGYGYDRPIAPNTTEEGRALNRRVYAVIQGSKTTTVNQTR